MGSQSPDEQSLALHLGHVHGQPLQAAAPGDPATVDCKESYALRGHSRIRTERKILSEQRGEWSLGSGWI